METKGFKSLVFYATQHGNDYLALVGSGHGGCPSLMRVEEFMLVCGKVMGREGMEKNQHGLDVLSNDSGQSLTIQTDEELVFVEIGLFDLAAKVRIKELMQKSGIVFTKDLERFFYIPSDTKKQEMQLTV